MRRVLCFAIAFVFLALIGLIFGRATTSSAYLARARFGEIREGMTLQEVDAFLMQTPGAVVVLERFNQGSKNTCFLDGKYVIIVWYKKDGEQREIVTSKKLNQGELSVLDHLMEGIGFPKSTPWPNDP